ncbi:MAG: hypothetical protein WC732_09810 [Candidatus Omnitrophota bacterium]
MEDTEATTAPPPAAVAYTPREPPLPPGAVLLPVEIGTTRMTYAMQMDNMMGVMPVPMPKLRVVEVLFRDSAHAALPSHAPSTHMWGLLRAALIRLSQWETDAVPEVARPELVGLIDAAAKTFEETQVYVQYVAAMTEIRDMVDCTPSYKVGCAVIAMRRLAVGRSVALIEYVLALAKARQLYPTDSWPKLAAAARDDLAALRAAPATDPAFEPSLGMLGTDGLAAYQTTLAGYVTGSRVVAGGTEPSSETPWAVNDLTVPGMRGHVWFHAINPQFLLEEVGRVSGGMFGPDAIRAMSERMDEQSTVPPAMPTPVMVEAVNRPAETALVFPEIVHIAPMPNIRAVLESAAAMRRASSMQ